MIASKGEHDRDHQIKMLEISSCEDCNDKHQCGLAEKSPFNPIPDNCPLPSPCEFITRHAESVQDPGQNDFNTPIVEPPDYRLAVGPGWSVKNGKILIHLIRSDEKHVTVQTMPTDNPPSWAPWYEECARGALRWTREQWDFDARLATVSEIQEYLKKEEGR